MTFLLEHEVDWNILWPIWHYARTGRGRIYLLTGLRRGADHLYGLWLSFTGHEDDWNILWPIWHYTRTRIGRSYLFTGSRRPQKFKWWNYLWWVLMKNNNLTKLKFPDEFSFLLFVIHLAKKFCRVHQVTLSCFMFSEQLSSVNHGCIALAEHWWSICTSLFYVSEGE